MEEQIDDLREEKQDILSEVAERTDLQARMNDMIAYLEEIPSPEDWWRFDEKIAMEMKSGLQMEVE